MNSEHLRSRLVALVIVSSLILGACGASGDATTDSTQSPGSTTSESIETTIDDSEVCDQATPVTVRLNWVYNFNHVPFASASELGFYEDECLDVSLEAGQGSVDTVTSVGSGAAQIGIADTTAIMQGLVSDVPVTGVAVLWRHSPFAVIIRDSALEAREISEPTPQDLEGMKFGAVTTAAVYTYWKAFVQTHGIDTSEVEEIPVAAPGTAELARGAVDFTVDFEAGKYAFERQDVPVTLMLGRDYGMDSYGLAVAVNDAWLAENEDAVRGFLRATARAMVYSAENPEEAIDHLAAFNPDVGLDEAAREQELKPHVDAINLWAEGGADSAEEFLRFTVDGLAATLGVLKNAGVLDETDDFDYESKWTDIYLPDPSEYLAN